MYVLCILKVLGVLLAELSESLDQDMADLDEYEQGLVPTGSGPDTVEG